MTSMTAAMVGKFGPGMFEHVNIVFDHSSLRHPVARHFHFHNFGQSKNMMKIGPQLATLWKAGTVRIHVDVNRVLYVILSSAQNVAEIGCWLRRGHAVLRCKHSRQLGHVEYVKVTLVAHCRLR